MNGRARIMPEKDLPTACISARLPRKTRTASTEDTQRLPYSVSKGPVTAMIKKVLITLFAAGAFSAAAYGGTDPAAFLNIGVGARAMGMGGAYTSVSDEPSAIYWN